MRILRKLKGRAGLSLAEMLLTTLILLLVSVIMVTGIPMAQNAYYKVIVGANARTLLSTTVSALRDELATAQDIAITGTTITYYSTDNGTKSKIYLYSGGDSVQPDKRPKTGTQPIMLQEYLDYLDGTLDYTMLDIKVDDTTKEKVKPRQLVSSKASNANLFVTYESVSASSIDTRVTLTFENLAVYSDSDTSKANPLAKLDTLVIRNVTAVPTPPPPAGG